jgi:uncharacterized membrane protein YjjB (DUF3815 family)
MSLSVGTVRSPNEKSHLGPAIVLLALLFATTAMGVFANQLSRRQLLDPVVTIGP